MLYGFINKMVALKRAVWIRGQRGFGSLTAEAVQGASLPFKGVDDIHGCDRLPLGMFAIGDGISDDIFEEKLEHTSDFFVNQSRDTLNTTSASQTSDGWFRDALDVITEHFAMTLGATLSKTLASFTTSRHDVDLLLNLG